jgi:hypothetical protein
MQEEGDIWEAGRWVPQIPEGMKGIISQKNAVKITRYIKIQKDAIFFYSLMLRKVISFW